MTPLIAPRSVAGYFVNNLPRMFQIAGSREGLVRSCRKDGWTRYLSTYAANDAVHWLTETQGLRAITCYYYGDDAVA